MEIFAFGENWKRFVAVLDESRVREAKRELQRRFGVKTLKGKRFLDVGCGSGVFSLAAKSLGAEVHSFDADPQAVACATALRERYFPHDRAWTIAQGSILDRPYLQSVGAFDFVYAWGVLHHTGDLWGAIANTPRLVKPRGLLCIGIYNTVGGPFGSAFWLRVKERYNRLPTGGKRLMEAGYATAFVIISMMRLQNPVKRIRTYRSYRGMNWWIDIRDWLGGYPYAYATPEEIITKYRELGLVLVHCQKTKTVGNNTFVFRKPPKSKGTITQAR